MRLLQTIKYQYNGLSKRNRQILQMNNLLRLKQEKMKNMNEPYARNEN